MNTYLIFCFYEIWNQGSEKESGYFLVHAISFEAACNKLKRKLENASNFKNCTII